MKKKYLVLCLNSPTLEVSGGPSLEACKAVIGATWLHGFCQNAKQLGLEVITPVSAAVLLDEAPPNASPDEFVLLAESFELGRWQILAARGIKDTICFNFESPLYLPLWFDAVADKTLPPHVKRFGFPLQGEIFDVDQVVFPSYSADQIVWDKGDRLDRTVAVISSKFVGMIHPQSPSFVKAFEYSKQWDRIAQLVRPEVDVFGRGWDMFDPFGIQALKGPIKPVEDKLALLKQYKRAYCEENTYQDGYVTEKSIEAIVAGCQVNTGWMYDGNLPFTQRKGDNGQEFLARSHTYNPFSHINATRVFTQELDMILSRSK